MNDILPFPTPWELPWEERDTAGVVTFMIARCREVTVTVRRDDNRLLRFDFSVCDSSAATVNFEHAFLPHEPIMHALSLAYHEKNKRDLDRRIQERAMHAFELLLFASDAARIRYRPDPTT
jgi:hypothetical protein